MIFDKSPGPPVQYGKLLVAGLVVANNEEAGLPPDCVGLS